MSRNLADGGAQKRVALLVLDPSMARTARAVPAVPPYAPMTLAELGRWLRRHRDDPQRCLRYCLEFLDEYRDASPADRRRLLSREPRSTGEPRWDAFLAALGEHLAFHEGMAIPVWTRRPNRFLPSAWFLSTLPSARAAAFSESPPAFKRRGIFVTEDFFARA